MIKKAKQSQTPSTAAASDCVISPAIPVEALSGLMFEHDEINAGEIAACVEGQSRHETFKHAEKMMTEHVLGRKYVDERRR